MSEEPHTEHVLPEGGTCSCRGGENNFHGHWPRECGEHRTVGTHRAWCYDCTEWCYPRLGMACKGCQRIAVVEMLAYVDLHIDTRFVTQQLTTPQKELYADLMDEAGHRSAQAEGWEFTPFERWWRDDA